MKLRNKKTWEIAEGYVTVGIQNNEKFPNPIEFHTYDSLAKLNEEWEDYEPTEPLIKDEKIRKAVRAWAEVNDFEPDCKVRYGANSYSLFSSEASIEFNIRIKGLEHLKDYTITELCGEEEE